MSLKNIVVHAPHASTVLPERFRDQFVISDQELEQEVLASADLWTDVLAQQCWPQANIITPEVSRVLLDVERYSDDSLEGMSKVGRGMIYSHSHTGEQIRRHITAAERRELHYLYYVSHWDHLRASAEGSVLLDLHSYPQKAWPIEPNAGASRPEIDLGHTSGLTSHEWLANLTKYFQSEGYSVGHNTPYDGVIDAGATDAVMIEIRRDVLGDGPGCQLWGRLVSSLTEMPLPGIDQ